MRFNPQPSACRCSIASTSSDFIISARGLPAHGADILASIHLSDSSLAKGGQFSMSPGGQFPLSRDTWVVRDQRGYSGLDRPQPAGPGRRPPPVPGAGDVHLQWGTPRCASTTCDLDLPARSPRRPKNCIEERGGGGAGGRAAGARPVSWSPPIEPGAHRPAPPELPAHERPVEDECSGLCPRRRAEVLDPPPSPSPSPCPQPRRISAALTPRTNPRTPPPATSPNDLRNDQLGDGPEVHSATVPGARKRGEH